MNQAELQPGDFHILVVDDEPGVRDTLDEVISGLGYRVTTAGSGQEALQALSEELADLVITDLMMPGMNGWQLLKLIQQKYPTVAIVVLTGYISQEGEAMLTSMHTSGYLVKPVDRAKLIETLDGLRATKKPDRVAEITIIDDDPDALSALEHTLKNRRFSISSFTDPVEALRHIRTTGPDLLITDLMLQDTDGFEVCRILREEESTSRLPILIVTAAPSKENVKKAIELNVNGFLAKPFDPSALLGRVRRLLEANPGT
jgi:CheY-like chemotaxis protein